MTLGSNQLAKAQEIAALKGLRAAVPFFVEATDTLAREKHHDGAVGVLAEVLSAREKKRGFFSSKDVDPLGPDRVVVAKQFAKLTRHAQINDAILDLLGAIAAENPDDSDIRLANAEGLYRAAYMADAIDEYRYCEKLLPDDGAIVARMGELYAVMSRNAEATEYLRRGLGELMQAQRFDEVPAFALKLLDVEPQSANDLQRWLESMSDRALSRQHADVTRALETVRAAGLDDGRWSKFEQRLRTLPSLPEEPEPQPIASYAVHVDPVAVHVAELHPEAQFEQASHEETEPEATLHEVTPHEATHPETTQPEEEPVWGSRSGPTATRSAWYDVSSVEPASEDEIAMLLGPSQSASENETAPASNNGAAASAQPQPSAVVPSGRSKLPVAPRAGVAGPSVRIGGTQPTSGGGLPPGLAAFTRRKADAAFTAGDFAGAAASYERLMKAGFGAEAGLPLVDCYLGLERFSDAAKLGLQLADHQALAGDVDKAVATLAVILEHTSDPEVERRHNELLAAR